MPSSAVLGTFALTALVVMAIPGPSVLYAVTRTVEHGRAAGLWSVLGLETGLTLHVLAAAAGVSALIASSDAALTALRLAGAAFLVWLGVHSWRHRIPGTGSAGRHRRSGLPARRAATGAISVGPPPSAARLFRDGLLVDLLNPKTGLFFLAFLPQFLEPTRGPAGPQVLLLGAVVVGLALACDLTYALVAGRLTRRLRTPRGRARLSAVAGVVYLGLAGLAAAG